MYRENDEQSEDKNNSELSGSGLSEKAEQVIEELENMHGDARQKIFELIEILRKDGLKDHQIGKVLVDRVKFVSRTTLYEYMPKELKRDYARKPLPKTINISSEHKVIDVEPNFPKHWNEEEEIKKIGELRRAIAKQEPEEDEKDLEIQFLKEKVAELEDALKKTEQFKPATQLQEQRDEYGTDENKVFDWLAKRDNGVTCFWYDSYGTELFKTRIFSQLKSKGVTTFKRLYFEI